MLVPQGVLGESEKKKPCKDIQTRNFKAKITPKNSLDAQLKRSTTIQASCSSPYGPLDYGLSGPISRDIAILSSR